MPDDPKYLPISAPLYQELFVTFISWFLTSS